MCASYDYEHADDTLEQFNERLKGHLNSFIYESAGSHKGFYVGNVIDCCRGMIEKFGDSGKQAILKSIRDTPSSELHTDMFELLQRGEQLSLVNGLAWCDNLVPHSSNDYSVRLQFLRAIKTVTPKDLAFAVKHIGPEPIDSLYGRLIQYAYLTQ